MGPMVGIGVMLGLYILARLTPTRWRAAAATLSVLAAVAVLVVVADLVARVTIERGLFEGKREEDAAQLTGLPSKTGEKSSATATRTDGGPITTQLGYGIAIAKDSTLHREFVAIHDPGLPVELVGTPGVRTVYTSSSNRYLSGDYTYRADIEVRAKENVRAVDVRFILFDVWGDDTRKLNYQEVADIAAGAPRSMKGQWNILSEGEVESHYASIAYVARVRLADGRVVTADPRAVLEEARRFNAKFSGDELDLDAEPTPTPSAKE